MYTVATLELCLINICFCLDFVDSLKITSEQLTIL